MYSTKNSVHKYSTGNIFLIGMMGAGKTTVGKLLARHLGKAFFDCDAEIQKRTGVTVSHIFDVEGEEGFRLREANLIRDLVQHRNIVLATGGGAILNSKNREALRDNGIVVYLKSSVGDLWLRTRNDRSRPLLQTPDPRTRLKELYDQRDPLYIDTADLLVKTGRQNVQYLVTHLQNQLEDLINSKHCTFKS